MFEVLLVVTTLLCGLVAGLLFGFAVVAMPGIGSLSDGEFIRAFQAMDAVIQRNQPIFMVVWIGSVLGMLGSVIIGFSELSGGDLALLAGAAIAYLAGVQIPTAVVNIPLNNRIQQVDVDGTSAGTLEEERTAFESRWNRWNRIRTALAILAVGLLLAVMSNT